MCGIIGYTGSKFLASKIVLDGLEKLEYRGYDSAGVAIIDESHQLTSVKRLGKVQELGDALSNAPLAGGTG
ncbi:glutamine--fructose-6-phosphate aminotransferase, partial [bacterium]|nr:glutamine--fructose-6-phosphate aminotransferase [bacterium]